MIRKDYAIVFAATLALVGGYFVVLTPGEAQEQPAPQPPNLFTAVDIPDWQDPLLPNNTPILRSRPVAVNFDVLADAQPAGPDADPPAVPIRFNLFDDLSVTAVFYKATPRYSTEPSSEPSAPSGYTWHGRLVGDHEGHVVMITDPGICAANIHISGTAWVRVRPLEGVQHTVREIGGSVPWECGCNVEVDSPGPSNGAEGGAGCGIIGQYNCEEGTTIDIMVPYTTLAKQQMFDQEGKDINLEIDLAIADANQVYTNSQVDVVLRQVWKGEIAYNDPITLGQLEDPWDTVLDELHPLRNAVRADLVAVIFGTGQSPFSVSRLMSAETPVFEARAFNLTFWGTMGSPWHALVHEAAHTMGCIHDRIESGCSNDCECSPGVCEFSFGHRLFLQSVYETIMWATPGPEILIPYFSNPDVSYCESLTSCAPTGEAPPSCDSADNARTINETKETVANFRASCDTKNTTTMATIDFFDGQGNEGSRSVSVSDNGQYMAFTSDATNFSYLGPSHNDFSDVYLYNRESGMVRVVSERTTHPGFEPGHSLSPTVSGNGRFIGFASYASDLDSAADTNGVADIYILPHYDGNLRRVSKPAGLGESDGDSLSPALSFSGRYVVFESDASNLVTGDDGLYRDIFVRDRDVSDDGVFDETGDVSNARVSLAADPLFPDPDGASHNPAISADDGQFVVFESDATNLLATGDTNGVRDIFVRDTFPPGQTFRVSVSTAGIAGDLASRAPSISGDGILVVFDSDATNLVANDNLGHRDIFVRNLGAVPQTTVRISAGLIGEANGDSFAPNISADGLFVVFHSDASNLVSGDTNGLTDVFLYERISGAITRLSINSLGLGEQALGGPSLAPAISADGRFVGFESDATNLVPDDQGGFRDIFFRDRGPM